MDVEKSLRVTSYHQGALVANADTEDFANLREAFEALKQRKRLVSFSTASIETIIYKGKKYTSEPEPLKEYIVALSRPLTKDDVKRMGTGGKALLWNMGTNNLPLVVGTRQGYLPVEEGAIVLDTNFKQIWPAQNVQTRTLKMER